MSTTLEALVATAVKEGWAVGSGSIAQIRHEAQTLGLTEVSVSRGGSSVTTLRSLSHAAAKTRSLSPKYGKGDQPLHTDGAHLGKPPDLVVLTCEGISDASTRLWSGITRHGRIYSFHLPDHLTHGVFLVVNGKDSFFCTAYSDSGFRYDPGCMVPCDMRARKTVHYFNAAMKSAVEHTWDEPGKTLVIDNRKALHARASAIDESHREVQRVSFSLKREIS
jgi:hypothetical protein